MANKKIKVGISIGDLNGIGAEVVFKTFSDPLMFDLCTPVVFASAKVLSFVKNHLNIDDTPLYGISKPQEAVDGKLNVVNLWKEPVNIQFGKEDPEVGRYAFLSLKAAVQALKTGAIDVLVTAPINKQSIQSDEFNFPGHTDYLAQELGGRALMFMVSDTLRVGLLTDHVPINDVAKHLTEELIIQKVKTISKSLQEDFGIVKPKIALLGINPHSGDNGLIGKEDETLLKPAIEQLKKEKILAFGPYPADGFFGSGAYKQFDAVLAAYHDQGLIPFKTLAFGGGVNFTAGLTKVRTSPDHGTAFDIAGKNLADASSFRQAVFTAIDVYNNRRQFAEISENPLPNHSKKFKNWRD